MLSLLVLFILDKGQPVHASPTDCEICQHNCWYDYGSINEATQARPSSLGVRGTLTLLLVDYTGVVTEAWIGKLPAEKESVVLSRLNAN
jgi:hypothetical protein